jgi:tetratricopeptide (TPR) repeat protein
MAAMEAADERAWHELVWQLAETLWALFLYSGHNPEWIVTYERGARAAARSGNLVAESRMWARLAAAYLRLNQPKIAEDIAHRAWQRARAAEDWGAEATALENLGSAAHAQTRLTEAIDYYRQSLALNEQHGRIRGVVLLLSNLGYALRDTNNHREALDSFQRCAELAATIGDHHSQAQALLGAGTVHARQGKYGRAISLMRDGLTMLSATEAPVLRAAALHQLGEVSQQAGDNSAARQYWQQALGLYLRLGDPRAHHLRDALAEPGKFLAPVDDPLQGP